MSSTADTITRLAGYLRENRIPMARVARETGLHPNTVRSALRFGRGRIDTLQQIEAMVEFHRTSNELAEAERPHGGLEAGQKAIRNYEDASGDVA